MEAMAGADREGGWGCSGVLWGFKIIYLAFLATVHSAHTLVCGQGTP